MMDTLLGLEKEFVLLLAVNQSINQLLQLFHKNTHKLPIEKPIKGRKQISILTDLILDLNNFSCIISS